MQTFRTSAVLASVVVFSACAATRMYQMPVTNPEGTTLFPALASAAQGMGLTAYMNPDSVTVALADGGQLIWRTEEQGFHLWAVLVSKDIPPDQVEGKFKEAKDLADRIWAQAVALRASSGVAPAPQ
jgi:hypothetical protein